MDVRANRKQIISFYLSFWVRGDMTVSYLASKDLERICRQFTTAPASVPEKQQKKNVSFMLSCCTDALDTP